MIKNRFFLLAIAAMLLSTLQLHASDITETKKDSVQRVIASLLPEHMGIGTLKARSIEVVDDSIKVDMSETLQATSISPSLATTSRIISRSLRPHISASTTPLSLPSTRTATTRRA